MVFTLGAAMRLLPKRGVHLADAGPQKLFSDFGQALTSKACCAVMRFEVPKDLQS